MNTNITTGKKAIQGMVRGFKVASEAIRLTYGHKGCNAVVEDALYPYHSVANDAQTIIQAIQVEDPVEKRGLGFLKELMDKSNKDSGDGRKTTAIIAEEILNLGYMGLELKRELDNLIPFIESKIDEQKQEITTEEIGQVAKVASESESIGQTIQEIYKQIGKDGVIHLEGSGTYATSYSLINGVRFIDTGYLSPFMCHDTEAEKDGKKANRAVYEKPTILVTKRKINTLAEINPLLDRLAELNKKDLVIFTNDMDSGVASVMIKAHQAHILNILIIKAPTLWQNFVFEDFAKITGSTIVEDATGITWPSLQLNHLGTCDKIIVDKEETIVMGIKDISDHIEELKKDGTNDSLLRLQWLQTKTAILRLGANSESELSYLRLKTSDAINSSRLALQDGVVRGGGLCLAKIADELPRTKAGKVLSKALKAPRKQIILNGGTEVAPNVLDASKVIKNAVRNAISLSTTILTSQIVIHLHKSKEQLEQEALTASKLKI